VRDRVLGQLLIVQQLIGFLRFEDLAAASTVMRRFCPWTVAHQAFHHLAQIDHLAGRHAWHVELADRRTAGVVDLDLDLILFELAVTQPAPPFRFVSEVALSPTMASISRSSALPSALARNLAARGLAQHVQ